VKHLSNQKNRNQ